MIEITSQILYQTEAKTSFQPFWERVRLTPRKSSSLLQRRTVDFSSHRSFRGSVEALKEHYGLTIPCSAVQQVTLDIAQKAQQYNASVEAAQYLENRRDQLGYHEAIEQDLPIGSGEVESGHRSVLQARLKKTGAWWKLENAESMSHLKVLQANQNWEPFWQSLAA